MSFFVDKFIDVDEDGQSRTERRINPVIALGVLAILSVGAWVVGIYFGLKALGH